jgi:WD40 repeat protein
MDRQRVDALKGMRIPLLLAQRPVAATGKMRVGVGIALDKNRLPDGLAVSATGWLAAVGTIDGIVDIYDLMSGQRLRSVVAERYASHLAFTANGRLLLTGSRQVRGLQAWDVHSGDSLKEVKEVMGPSALSADNRHVFFTNAQRGLGIYDLVGGTMVGPYYWAGGTVTALAVDPVGRRVTAVTFDGVLTTWEVVHSGSGGGLALTKLAEARITSTERPASLAFAADGSQLFATTAHHRLEAWQVRDLAFGEHSLGRTETLTLSLCLRRLAFERDE